MENSKPKIMIVDDDYDNLQLTKDILQYGGFETYDFLDPQLALDIFHQNPNRYDLIVMDINMEKLNGIQVYKEIKKVSPAAKVFVFTGMEVNGNKFKDICPSFNEQQIIKKPVRVDTLIKIMKEAIVK
jgi:CheY-like chemotaxis protein